MNEVTTEIALERINKKIEETNCALYVTEFEYIGKNKSRIKMKCSICGKETERNYWRFIHSGGKCECQHKIKKWTNERCINFIKEIDVNDEYEFIKCDTGKSITIKHKICGHEFTRASWNLKDNGLKCPICYSFESLGEKNIECFLINNNIDFEKQKRYKECRNIKTLPFDFYLPKYNVLIEFDGEQHFKPIDHLGGEKHYKDTVRNDNIKNEFCKKNNIQLLRIPYYNINNIENILNNFLNNIN